MHFNQKMVICLSGSQRVRVQFQRLFCLPEPQQDRRDPFPEQNFEPAQNQVSKSNRVKYSILQLVTLKKTWKTEGNVH